MPKLLEIDMHGRNNVDSKNGLIKEEICRLLMIRNTRIVER